MQAEMADRVASLSDLFYRTHTLLKGLLREQHEGDDQTRNIDFMHSMALYGSLRLFRGTS